MSDKQESREQQTGNDLNVEDVFVFRRVEKHRFVHVGGIGRGEGWAGLTELRLDDRGPARSAYEENRMVEQADREPVHVFGPYWSPWSAFVPVDHDVMVLFGGPWRDKARGPAALQEVAASTARKIQIISPAKRLADELEILHAVQNLMSCEPATTLATLQHIIRCATEALSCEFGIIWLRREGEHAVSERGWSPDVEASRMPGILERHLENIADGSVCIQDASECPLPAPFLLSKGVRSYYVLTLGNLAAMLLVHTRLDPRGFTQLCQELGRRLAESSELLLRAALQRDNLVKEVERVSDEARRDSLTGLANRLAWDERLEQIAEGPADETAAIIYLDLSGLKRVNDRYGHKAGDAHIQAMADIVRENIRPCDFAARIGGDEFAILLPGSGAESCDKVLDRLNAAVEARPGIHGIPIGFASGSGICGPGGDIHGAVREADVNLIHGKQTGH